MALLLTVWQMQVITKTSDGRSLGKSPGDWPTGANIGSCSRKEGLERDGASACLIMPAAGGVMRTRESTL